MISRGSCSRSCLRRPRTTTPLAEPRALAVCEEPVVRSSCERGSCRRRKELTVMAQEGARADASTLHGGRKRIRDQGCDPSRVHPTRRRPVTRSGTPHEVVLAEELIEPRSIATSAPLARTRRRPAARKEHHDEGSMSASAPAARRRALKRNHRGGHESARFFATRTSHPPLHRPRCISLDKLWPSRSRRAYLIYRYRSHGALRRRARRHTRAPYYAKFLTFL